MMSEMEHDCFLVFNEYQGYGHDVYLRENLAPNGDFVALGPTHIIPPSDTEDVTRGYPSTRRGSSAASGPGSGSGGSGLWNRGEQYFDHIGAQYAGYELDDSQVL